TTLKSKAVVTLPGIERVTSKKSVRLAMETSAQRTWSTTPSPPPPFPKVSLFVMSIAQLEIYPKLQRLSNYFQDIPCMSMSIL
ncbi:unnamed protein product, partial [Candidula unifasciata]